MSTNDNKSVIRTFIEDVINQGRLERADDIVIEDFVELDPLPGQAQGREGLKEVIRQMRSAFPDIRPFLCVELNLARKLRSADWRLSKATRSSRRACGSSPGSLVDRSVALIA